MKEPLSNNTRKCWLLDANEAGSWATPSVGMHKLYMPAYFRTENKVNSPSQV